MGFTRVHFITALGSSIPLVWFFTMTASRSLPGFPSHVRLLFYLGIGACMLLCACLPALRRATGQPVLWRLAGAILFAVPLVVGAHAHATSIILCACMLLAGIALAWAFLRWFCACCLWGATVASRLTLIAFALAAGLRLLLALIATVAPIASLCMVSALMLASTVLMEQGRLDRQDDPTDERAAVAMPAPDHTGTNAGTAQKRSLSLRAAIPYLLEISLCSLILGGSRDLVSSSPMGTASLIVNYLLRILVPIGMYAWVALHDAKRSHRPVQYAVVGALLALLALSIFGGPRVSEAISQALLLLAWDFVLIVIYLAALRDVFVGHAEPLAALGLYRGTYELFLGAGMAIAELTRHFGLATELGEIPRNVILFLVGTVFLLAVNRLAIVTEGLGTATSPTDAAPTASPLERQCRRIGDERGLTDREIQIMIYICQGFSKGFIAQELGLAENTVRWHSKNLYEKLGIHSKQELLKMVK